MPDKFLFKGMFAGKVDEHDPQQHGQESLPRQHEHGDAGEEKNEPQNIFDQ